MNNRLFKTHRSTHFTVTLLDKNEREKGELKRVSGGEITLSAATRLKSSGTIDLTNPPEDIDWLSDRIRIVITVNGESWPLGTFLVATPETQYAEHGKRYRVELVSKLAILDTQTLDHTLSLPVGTRIIESATLLILRCGETRVALTPSDATLRTAMTWEAGTSYLTVINGLLESAGYWSLSANGYGTIQSSPYTRPNQRPTVCAFNEGENATHLANWTREHNHTNIPNKITLITTSDPPLIAIATNTNPSNPYSYAVRGRWISRVERGIEASSQDILDALAQRRLLEASTAQLSMTVEFMPVPLTPNDVVRWKSQGHECLATVQTLTYSLDPTSLCKAKLREVVET